MKLIKKLLVFVLVFMMILSVAGCSGLKVVREIASVDGNLISKPEFMYYLEGVKGQMLQEAGITAGTEEAKSFWEAGEIDGQKASDAAKNRAMEECIRVEIASILAKEKGYTIPAEIKTMMKETAKADDEQVKQIKELTGLSESLLITVFEKTEYTNMFAQGLIEEQKEMMTPADADVQKKYVDEYARVKHVLISSTPESEEAAVEGFSLDDYKNSKKLLAAEVAQKAKDGADFDELVKEYGEDPGMETSPDGYTFTRNGGMVKEFEEAALNLAVGQVSDMVETSFGWHIIKRYDLMHSGTDYDQVIASITNQLQGALYNDYIDSLKENYEIKIQQGTLNSIKLK